MPPAPSLSDLQKPAGWLWLICRRLDCGHRKAILLAPLITRFGPHASSDILRQRARCSRCGSRGALTILPSWAGTGVGWAPFPLDPPG